jgi:hypothetical protein
MLLNHVLHGWLEMRDYHVKDMYMIDFRGVRILFHRTRISTHNKLLNVDKCEEGKHPGTGNWI